MILEKTTFYIKMSTPKSIYSGKLAIFDLDSTIIKPKKGKSPRNPYSEYDYCYPNVINKLREYSKNLYQVVVITNQKGLKTEQNKLNWIEKINKIQSEIMIELIVLAALCDDSYRKPRTGFLEFIRPNSESFFCGDALGRQSDHSDSDLKFALNLNIRCLSPEFVFKNKVELSLNDVVNTQINYAPVYKLNYYKTFRYFNFEVNSEVIIMVGIQGAGKSLLSKWIQQQNAFMIYDIISRDEEGTMKKCLNKMEKLIQAEHNIIIDNTNPTKQSRKPYIEIAKKYGYDVKIINFTRLFDDYNMAQHNNYYRHCKFGIRMIPNVAIYKFLKEYEEPEYEEGLDDIISISYMLPTLEKDYFKYWY
jgi:bifunctional polynucleotide phosphatase/kinase